MAQRFDPITDNFPGISSLSPQDPSYLVNSLMSSGMPIEQISLQTGISPDQIMMLQSGRMNNVPVQPPMALSLIHI